MKKLTVNCQVQLTDVYDDSWGSDPSAERVEYTLIWHLKRCMSDKGTVDIQGLKISYEVESNADN